MSVRSRAVLVTGGTRGIGRSVCEALARDGHTVYVGCRVLDKGRAVAESIGKLGGRASAIRIDVSDAASIEAAAAELGSNGVVLGALINNAGVALDGFDADVVHETMAVNVRGVMDVTRLLSPLVEEGGSIVMVSSGMGELSGLPAKSRVRFAGNDHTPEEILQQLGKFEEAVRTGCHREQGWPSAAYSLSKAALNAYVRWLAASDPNHRINSVCPGWVRTDMGGSSAPRSVEGAATGIVWAATLNANGPTGGFFRDGEPIDW